MTPLLKKAGLDADNLASYRPISQLSLVSKLLEKHVAIQIRQHMEFNDIFDTFQSVYRSAHSCETAMVQIQDDILKALDCGKHIILVLLDLSAAFDSVDHDILLDKLHMIGVRGDALRWVESYLSARTQVIRIGDATSQPIHLPCLVPQGSVPGRCFLIYTATTISAVYLPNIVTGSVSILHMGLSLVPSRSPCSLVSVHLEHSSIIFFFYNFRLVNQHYHHR